MLLFPNEFRCFKPMATILFEPGVNLLVGSNGSGKSTVLASLCSHGGLKDAFWHDCGKPFCKVVDSEGKSHFPGHAKKSAEIFRELYPEWEQSARLIEQDMDIHTLSAEELEEFAKRPEAVALLLSGLAAVHANAEMFGGLMSDSFKSKWKHLDRRGKALCKIILGG